MSIDYSFLSIPVREDLISAHRRCWDRIAAPGTWWTGAQRLEIAAHARTAVACDLCARRAQAISPVAVDGGHSGSGDLDPAIVDVVHRIRMDSGRLTQAWFESVVPALMREEAYVELVALVASIATIDSFTRSLGMAPHELPLPQQGEPAQVRPRGARRTRAWVSTVAPEDLTADDPDIYVNKSAANIHRALSLVPNEVEAFFDLDDVHYLPDAQLRDFEHEPRAISHAQIELLAARMSALNQCVY